MRLLVLAAIALGFCGAAHASESCPVSVRIAASQTGTGLQIDGSSCTTGLADFWASVERRLPRPLPSNLTWLSVVGPVSPDNLAALSSAWSSSCTHRTRQSSAFLLAYAAMPASRVSAPSLAAFRPAPDGIDNLYPLNPASKGVGVRSPGCTSVLLPPVIYYRVQAPNKSFKPKPLRGSA